MERSGRSCRSCIGEVCSPRPSRRCLPSTTTECIWRRRRRRAGCDSWRVSAAWSLKRGDRRIHGGWHTLAHLERRTGGPAFLKAFEETHLVTEAAKCAGVGRRAVYNRRASGEQFAQAWEDVEQRPASDFRRIRGWCRWRASGLGWLVLRSDVSTRPSARRCAVSVCAARLTVGHAQALLVPARRLARSRLERAAGPQAPEAIAGFPIRGGYPRSRPPSSRPNQVAMRAPRRDPPAELAVLRYLATVSPDVRSARGSTSR